jgi:hypothetical protein
MTTQDSQDLQLPADTLADGFDDDADWEVAPPPRRRLHWTTAVLVIAAAAVAAFAGGILAQKHWGGSSSSGFTVPGGGRLPSGFPGATAGGATTTGTGSASGFPASLAQGAFGGGTRGTVSYVDGDILYVSTGSGSVVKVRVPRGLAVDRTVKAKASSIRPGETVVVQGTAGANGAVKATGVTVTAS